MGGFCDTSNHGYRPWAFVNVAGRAWAPIGAENTTIINRHSSAQSQHSSSVTQHAQCSTAAAAQQPRCGKQMQQQHSQQCASTAASRCANSDNTSSNKSSSNIWHRQQQQQQTQPRQTQQQQNAATATRSGNRSRSRLQRRPLRNRLPLERKSPNCNVPPTLGATMKRVYRHNQRPPPGARQGRCRVYYVPASRRRIRQETPATAPANASAADAN